MFINVLIFFSCFNQFKKSYQSDYGGFSSEPKFPQASNQNFLMTYYFLNPDLEDALVSLLFLIF